MYGPDGVPLTGDALRASIEARELAAVLGLNRSGPELASELVVYPVLT